MLENGGLADPGLTPDHQRRAGAVAGVLEQVLDQPMFGIPPD
jgi:hypothetical protein